MIESLENKKFKTILIDPPWNEVGGGKIKRGADKYKKLLKTKEIISYCKNLKDHIENDAHLYIWVSNNFLLDGIEVIKEIGFQYKTNIVWTKKKAGLGQYFRGKHQLCLFATKGDGYAVRTPAKDITTWLGNTIIPATLHSKKPLNISELVEQRSYGPYLELFTDNNISRQNWTTIIL